MHTALFFALPRAWLNERRFLDVVRNPA